MSYFDDASLVMIPSGYKTSKVYSVKPTDGSGDLTFSRSNDTATRVNSAGLIEKVRTNLYPRGSALLTTGWTTQGATLTAGQSDPNGGTTALRVQLAAGGSNYIYYAAATTANLSMTRSVYIKAASAQSLRFEDPSGVGGVTINVTTSWQRYTLSLPSSGGGTYGIYFDNTPDAAAKDFTIAFVQIETGDIATDYIATTTAAVSVGPVANVPRLDYLNSSCPRLLLEPQRTNLLTNSENFSSGYFATDVTVTSNTSVSPDGYTSADTITEGVQNNLHRVGQNFSAVSGSVYTASIFCKAGSGTRNLGILFGCTFGEQEVVFNVNNGTIVSSSGATGTITNYGNGWYRCTATATSQATASTCAQFQLRSGTNQSYAGNGTSSLIYWGAQVELGAYATSYIPTLGAAVTRGADACSKTGLGAYFGSTYTLFGEIQNKNVNGSRHIAVKIPSGSMYDNFITIYQNFSTLTATGNDASGNTQFFITGNTLALDSTVKFALRCETNNVAFYINGNLIGTDNSAYIPAVTAWHVGGYTDIRELSVVKQAIVFPTALTNAQLAELTTI